MAAVRGIHADFQGAPELAIAATLRIYPPACWGPAIDAFGRHYAGDQAMPAGRSALSVFEGYLRTEAQRIPAVPAAPARDWRFKGGDDHASDPAG